MSRTIVSIISEQTIPNYIFIKEMYEEGDKLLMIMSNDDKIIQKEQFIENTLNYPFKPTTIIFDNKGDEESWQAMQEKIVPYLNPDEEFLINLTGGTKYMALAVEMIFSSYNSKYYYIPFPKNTILQLHSDNAYDIAYRVSVEEYMGLHGLPVSASFITQSKAYAQHLLYMFTDKHFLQKHYMVLEKLRAYRDTKKPLLIEELETREDTDKKPRISGLSSFLQYINFPLRDKCRAKIDKYEIRYITGGWFEEYTYYLVEEKFKPTDIQLGVLIRETQTTNMNDLDVVFTLGNKLFVIECKTGVGKQSLFNQIVYKSSALKETLLGLPGKSYIFSLSNADERLYNIAKNMGVIYCDVTYFSENDKLESWVKNIQSYAHN